MFTIYQSALSNLFLLCPLGVLNVLHCLPAVPVSGSDLISCFVVNDWFERCLVCLCLCSCVCACVRCSSVPIVAFGLNSAQWISQFYMARLFVMHENIAMVSKVYRRIYQKASQIFETRLQFAK